MAGKKTTSRAAAAAATEEPTKAELQRRMEEAREEISETVEEIKDTVTDRYESVKETVAETFDWRAQFRKHSVAFSLGALAVGFVVGSGIAAALKDATPKRSRKSSGWLDELYALGETLAGELSGVTQTLLLPALSKKIKDKFGVDISEKLLAARASRRTIRPSKKSVKRGGTKKAASKRSGTKARASNKRAAKRSAR
ncbi:MAG TPA: hypothetical protein VF791_12235 [Pyrinomonadaceae bacterium]